MALEMRFCGRFDVSWNLTWKSRQNHACMETHTMLSFWQHFFVSQEIINLLYIRLVLSKVKTRSKISMHIQICNRYILQAQLQLQQCFSDLISSAKETSTYQNAFSYAIEEPPPDFQLEVVNLQCNSMLKDKY